MKRAKLPFWIGFRIASVMACPAGSQNRPEIIRQFIPIPVLLSDSPFHCCCCCPLKFWNGLGFWNWGCWNCCCCCPCQGRWKFWFGWNWRCAFWNALFALCCALKRFLIAWLLRNWVLWFRNWLFWLFWTDFWFLKQEAIRVTWLEFWRPELLFGRFWFWFPLLFRFWFWSLEFWFWVGFGFWFWFLGLFWLFWLFFRLLFRLLGGFWIILD